MNKKHTKNDSFVIERIRDELKLASIYTDDEAAYVLIGIESQTSVHYAMPVRGMVYDSLQYAQQVRQYQAQHRANGEKASGAEFLSGIHKEDKLTPVITVAVYFGLTPWDGPRKLSQMMKRTDRGTARFIQDYEIPVIEPYAMTDEELDSFKTDFGDVFRFLKYAGDEEQIKHLLNSRPSYQHMRRIAAQVLSLCAGIDINTEDDGEVIDVCKAWDDHRLSGMREGRAEGYSEGIEQGIKQGIEKGIEQGIVKGIAQGIEKGRNEATIDFVKSLGEHGMNIEEIASILKLSREDVKKCLNAARITS